MEDGLPLEHDGVGRDLQVPRTGQEELFGPGSPHLLRRSPFQVLREIRSVSVLVTVIVSISILGSVLVSAPESSRF